MSGAPCHPALRARISESLAQVLADHPARSLGRQLGHAGHTITDRGADLGRWPLLDALLLAAEHDGLRAALIACLQGAEAAPVGEAVAQFGHLLQTLGRDSAMHSQFAAMLADGRISQREARAARDAILARRDIEDRELLPALVAGMRA